MSASLCSLALVSALVAQPPPALLEGEGGPPAEASAPDAEPDERRPGRREPTRPVIGAPASDDEEDEGGDERASAASDEDEEDGDEGVALGSFPWATAGCGAAAASLPLVPGSLAAAGFGIYGVAGVAVTYPQLASNPAAGCALGLFSCSILCGAAPAGLAGVLAPLLAAVGAAAGAGLQERPTSPAWLGALPGIVIGLVGGVLALASPLIWMLVLTSTASTTATASPEVLVAVWAGVPVVLLLAGLVAMSGGPLAAAGAATLVALEPDPDGAPSPRRERAPPAPREMPPPASLSGLSFAY